MEATRAAGYAVNPGLLVQGSWGIGAAVFDGAGEPAWALSIFRHRAPRLPERRPLLGSLLLRHAHAISEKITR